VVKRNKRIDKRGMIKIIKVKKPKGLVVQPYKHQIQAAKFLIKKKAAILADEMGAGKTMSSILAANTMGFPVLIVCPASVKYNWEKEIKLVDSFAQIHILTDNKEITDWNIINYDILKNFSLLKKLKWKTIIFDEAHYCRGVTNYGSPKTQRAKDFLALSKRTENLYALTGSPVFDRPKDLYNVLKAIKHSIGSMRFIQFAKRYCGAYNNGFGWVAKGSSNTEELNNELKSCMLRRLKKDLLDLPDKIRTFLPVEINIKQYNKEVKQYEKEKKEELLEGGFELALQSFKKHLIAKLKIKHTIELAKSLVENDQQVIIFTFYSEVIKQVQEYFGDITVKLDGNCTAKQKQEAVDLLQSGKKKIFVANMIAGGVGITLTAANNLIFNDMDWTPENHRQAEDRPHRIGQKNNVNIFYMYAKNSEMDEKLIVYLKEKLTAISEILDDGENNDLALDIVEAMK
jgi:SWI/SNF-related matrix-associated actin-dependent regulator 1 of chromatin subfamily A